MYLYQTRPYFKNRAWSPVYAPANWPTSHNLNFKPAMNAKEFDDRYEIDFQINDIDLNQIKISAEGHLVTLSYQAKLEEQVYAWVRREFKSESFSRQIELPEDSLPAQLTAKAKPGILSLIVPKLVKEPAKTIAIEIDQS